MLAPRTSLLSWSCSGVVLCATASACVSVGRPAPTPVSPPGPVQNEAIEVAITLDDLPRHGPDIPGLSRLSIHQAMLAVFAKHHLPPVYGFINAKKLAEHPEDRAALDAWRAAGQPLGNHTYSHPQVSVLTLQEYLADIDANELTLRALVGSTPADERRWKVFRYPFLREGKDLESRAAIRRELAARGYRIAPVSIDFYDWAYNAPYARCLAKGDAKAIAALKEDYIDQAAAALRWSDAAARTLVGRPIKQILLLHVGAFDAVMLDELLTVFERNDARFISLDDALADPVYAEEPRSPKATGGHFLGQIRKARGTRSPVVPIPPETLLDLVCR